MLLGHPFLRLNLLNERFLERARLTRDLEPFLDLVAPSKRFVDAISCKDEKEYAKTLGSEDVDDEKVSREEEIGSETLMGWSISLWSADGVLRKIEGTGLFYEPSKLSALIT